MKYTINQENIVFPGRLKKLDSKCRGSTKIYTGNFRTSPVEVLHVEAYDPLLTKKGWAGTKIPV